MGHMPVGSSGLLMCSLTNAGGDEIASLNMVVQVTEEGGSLIRTVYNPLD
jgi:hypothetical protein